MKVKKALNNNMVLAVDGQGNDCICQGKGLGYGRKKGDVLSEDEIERQFVPADADESRYFQQLFSEIPEVFWKIAEDVVDYAKREYGIQVSQKILLPLCDHMAGSVERYRDGICLDNPMLWDIKRVYPEEFQTGLYALELLKEQCGVAMHEDEAGFLAYHFVNAELGKQRSGAVDTEAELILHVVGIVKAYFGVVPDEADWNYQRFLAHLKFFAKKVAGGARDEDVQGDMMFESLKQGYPDVYRCVMRIRDYIFREFAYAIGQEEQTYLMFHIQRVLRSATEDKA